jgi:hypothetical protein
MTGRNHHAVVWAAYGGVNPGKHLEQKEDNLHHTRAIYPLLSLVFWNKGIYQLFVSDL